MKKIIRNINEMNRISRIVLHTGLPLIAVNLLFIVIYMALPKWELWYIQRVVPAMLEYIMMSLTLIIGGALLIDYALKKGKDE